MKVELPKENFLEAITLIEKMSGKHLTLPVLQCILLVAKRRMFTLRATNLDIGVEISLPAKVDEEGEVAVPAALLQQVVQNTYSAPQLTLTLEGGNLSLRAGGSATLIKSQPHEEFPTLPLIEDTNSFHIKSDELLRGLKAVWYSASTSTIRPELASVFLFAHGSKLTCVATDSFRLAEKVIPLKETIEIPSLLIPARNIGDIIRILEWTSGTSLEVRLTENQLSFSTENLYLTSRLIDGSFPDYKQIIPKTFTAEVIALKQDLLGALKKASLFSGKFNQVEFSVHPKKKRFEIKAQNADTGETSDPLVATLGGEDIDIRFNHRYLSDCFQSINSDSVSLSLAGEGKPMVLRGVSDNSFLYLVMPMNK